jgi:hypothetical protein
MLLLYELSCWFAEKDQKIRSTQGAAEASAMDISLAKESLTKPILQDGQKLSKYLVGALAYSLPQKIRQQKAKANMPKLPKKPSIPTDERCQKVAKKICLVADVGLEPTTSSKLSPTQPATGAPDLPKTLSKSC